MISVARMDFNGTEDFMTELFKEGERLKRKAPEMLEEAGKDVVLAWQNAIEKAGHAPPGKSKRSTGDMINSVKAGTVKQQGGAYLLSIYPQGKDRKGKYNAEKAFVLHYGTSKIHGDHFVDAAEEQATEAIENRMQEVWERE